MKRQLTIAVTNAKRRTVAGRFERHVSYGQQELTGSSSGGRWGPPGAYSVLYLGRPRDSIVVEAYRHLVDPFAAAGMTGEMVARRRLLISEVSISNVLDLRDADTRRSVGLDLPDLRSPVGSYEACWAVGQVAHRLGLHGILAPSATGLGETLALFEQHLPAEEVPKLVDQLTWESLPPDPRRLRIVQEPG